MNVPRNEGIAQWRAMNGSRLWRIAEVMRELRGNGNQRQGSPLEFRQQQLVPAKCQALVVSVFASFSA